MVSKKIIKELAKKENKKIGHKAIEKIEKILIGKVEEILKTAARQADFGGRGIIKGEDVE